MKAGWHVYRRGPCRGNGWPLSGAQIGAPGWRMGSSHTVWVGIDAIKWIESILTVAGSKVVHANAEFDKLAPPRLQVMPDWSPVPRAPGHFRPHAPILASAH